MQLTNMYITMTIITLFPHCQRNSIIHDINLLIILFNLGMQIGTLSQMFGQDTIIPGVITILGKPTIELQRGAGFRMDPDALQIKAISSFFIEGGGLQNGGFTTERGSTQNYSSTMGYTAQKAFGFLDQGLMNNHIQFLLVFF